MFILNYKKFVLQCFCSIYCFKNICFQKNKSVQKSEILEEHGAFLGFEINMQMHLASSSPADGNRIQFSYVGKVSFAEVGL